MAEQEAKVSLLFISIADGFQQVDSTSDISRLKPSGGMLRADQDVKAYASRNACCRVFTRLRVGTHQKLYNTV
jgi:hypothetical protein